MCFYTLGHHSMFHVFALCSCSPTIQMLPTQLPRVVSGLAKKDFASHSWPFWWKVNKPKKNPTLNRCLRWRSETCFIPNHQKSSHVWLCDIMVLFNPHSLLCTPAASISGVSYFSSQASFDLDLSTVIFQQFNQSERNWLTKSNGNCTALKMQSWWRVVLSSFTLMSDDQSWASVLVLASLCDPWMVSKLPVQTRTSAGRVCTCASINVFSTHSAFRHQQLCNTNQAFS